MRHHPAVSFGAAAAERPGVIRRRPSAWAPLLAATLSVAVAGALLAWLNRGTAGAAPDEAPTQIAVGLAYLAVGALVLGRGGNRRVGGLLAGIGAGNPLGAAGH